jgi:3-oxoacyl-[acyl-carrier-protein] synthase-3
MKTNGTAVSSSAQPHEATRPDDRRPAGHAVAAVAGLGYHLPEQTITNADLAALVDTSDEWITARTGIKSRRRAGEDDATSDLAAAAARAALADARLAAADLDHIITATVTPDSPVPCAACRVQDLLGATGAAAFDINAGCSGFLYGVHTADALIRSGAARNVLVIGAEVLTRVTDYHDRRTCVLFGDGAGACVMSTQGPFEVLHSHIGADGSQPDIIEIPAGGSRIPASSDSIANRQHYIRLDGRRVFRQAVRRMVEAARVGLEATGLTADDVSWVIPHQANERIIMSLAEQLSIPVPKVVRDLADTGNTSAASVPIALARANAAGSFEPGQVIMLLAFGAGLTWSCQLLRVT